MSVINWDFIDKVVYINLKKRTDRNESIKKELQRVGIPQDKVIRFEAIEDPVGGIGCASSHAAVLAMAERHHWENVLILEDDMMFNEDDASYQRLNNFFVNLQEIQWDVGFISASYYIIKKVKDEFYRVEFAYLSNSYLVNRPYYGRLMQNFHESIALQRKGVSYGKSSLDYNWLQLMAKDQWYGVYPCAGYQKPGMSDIDRRMVDGKADFYRNLDELKKYGSY